MKTARRAPIEPDAKFGRILNKVRKTGEKLSVDGITIIPPTGTSSTWRLRTSYKNQKLERKSPDTIGDVNAAFTSPMVSGDRKSTRLNSSHSLPSRMPSSA